MRNMLVFKIDLFIEANKWSNEEEKQVFMKNAEDVVNRGLARMTVPDWKAVITDAEEK